MSREIETQLEQLLAQLPEPDPAVTERALAKAVDALAIQPLRPRRPLRAFALLLAAALALLAVAAGALAAAGALHVSLGQPTHHTRQTTTPAAAAELQVPPGAHGIAIVVGGRLWLTTSNGLRLQGLPVSAATLSPRALYVAAGIGNSLVAMAPSGRRAWSHPTAGSVTAIAWAPDGIRIAYIVQLGRRFQLHLIEGNGRNDRLIDRAVRPVTPSWRADSLAIAYVGAGGKPIAYDLAHRSRHLFASAKAAGANRLAFAPTGTTLAIGTRHGFLVAGGGAPANGFDFSPAPIAGIGWLDGRLAVAVNPAYPSSGAPFIQLFEVRHGAADATGSLVPPAPLAGFDAKGSRLTLAVTGRAALRILASTPGTPATRVRLRPQTTVLTLPPKSRVGSLDVR